MTYKIVSTSRHLHHPFTKPFFGRAFLWATYRIRTPYVATDFQNRMPFNTTQYYPIQANCLNCASIGYLSAKRL